MPHFDIRACRSTQRRDLGGNGTPIRTLELDGHTTGADPRPIQAILVFAPELDGHPAPAVGYATATGPSGITLVGWFPASAYAAHQAALSAPARAQVRYELRDPAASSGYLRRIRVCKGSSAATAASAARCSTRRCGPARSDDLAVPL